MPFWFSLAGGLMIKGKSTTPSRVHSNPTTNWPMVEKSVSILKKMWTILTTHAWQVFTISTIISDATITLGIIE